MRDRDSGRTRKDTDRLLHDDRSTERARPLVEPRQRAAAEQQADREREQARYRAVGAKIRMMDEHHPLWCHAYTEHRRATDTQLCVRARTGESVRGQEERARTGAPVPDPRRPPADATRWRDDESLGRAYDRLRNSDEFRKELARNEAWAQKHPGVPARFAVRGKLQDVIGPDWRQHVYGRSCESGGRQPTQWGDDSRAVAAWKRQEDGRWHLLTCYPEAVRPSSRLTAGITTR